MGSLQRTIDLYDIEIDAFRAYKDRLIDYLERFIKDLIGIGGEIATLLGEIEPARVDYLLTIVARRAAEDAAPGGGDPGSEERTLARPHSSRSSRAGASAGRGSGGGSCPRPSIRASRSCCGTARVKRSRISSP